MEYIYFSSFYGNIYFVIVKQQHLQYNNKEADTDISSVIKFNNHAETVQRILDVVRKTANGTDFIIWSLENQEKIHYSMPLRHMIADALIYLKEYNELSAKNKKKRAIAPPVNFYPD